MKRGYHGWTKTAVKWPNRIHIRIDAYPLVGLALTLLVIFMLVPAVTPPHHGWSVDLPQSRYDAQGGSGRRANCERNA